MSHILIIEDEQNLQTILQYNLKAAGYETTSVTDGKKALSVCQKVRPDLILLDWMLPNVSGIDICRLIRQNHDIRQTPVIMLTARAEDSDKIKAFENVDDYLTKPFSLPELLARIRALLRRCPKKVENQKICFEDLVFDETSKHVSRKGGEIHLGPTEFRLLKFFLENQKVALTREDLLKGVWGHDIYVEPRTIDAHIKRLRKALCVHGDIDLIKTLRGVGYRLIQPRDG